MDKAILRAYTIINGSEPALEMAEWQAAEYILNNMDVPRLGEDLAKECLFRIINYTSFPDRELTRSIVGVAEEKISEFYPELGIQDHVHMDVVAELERKYWEEKEKEKEQEHKSEIKIK